jgi:hypothetical protein
MKASIFHLRRGVRVDSASASHSSFTTATHFLRGVPLSFNVTFSERARIILWWPSKVAQRQPVRG